MRALSRSLFALFVAFSAHAAQWIELAPVLVPRQEVGVTSARGKLYLAGGFATDASVLDSVEEYDPATNSWRFIAPLPRPRHHAPAVALGDAIYIVGGYETFSFDPQRSVFRYDLDSGTWSSVAPLPSARGALAAVAIGGKIYAVGGVPGTGRELTVYDPALDAWTTLAQMPTAREHLAAVTIDGLLYVAGGRNNGNTNAFERYDPATNRWTILPPLPAGGSGLAAAVLGRRIYIFGGEGNPSTPTGVYADTASYDVDRGTWRLETPMPHPRHGIAAATIGERIHIPAGGPVQGFSTTSAHDALVLVTRRRSVRH
ncbi:MAG TPA: kelch repeat-containing protein [Thermoanaerobaculia bacterium]|jgi:N-acetylneuraminic acid mutarotase